MGTIWETGRLSPLNRQERERGYVPLVEAARFFRRPDGLRADFSAAADADCIYVMTMARTGTAQVVVTTPSQVVTRVIVK